MAYNNAILLTGARIVTAEKDCKGSVLIDGSKIAGVWYADADGLYPCESSEDGKISEDALTARLEEKHPGLKTVRLDGKLLMAGGIDAHVHFREPGMTHKADMESESMAALLGGVTSFIDMPNTKPQTTDIDALEAKCALAAGRCHANYGFHLGANNGNLENLKRYLAEGDGYRFAGIKVFMGSSTGNMLVDNNEVLDKLFSIPGKEILIHSEDEATIRANLDKAKSEYGDNIPMRMHSSIRSRQACIRSTIKALELALRHSTHLHVLHVSTAEEVEMIRVAKQYNPDITAETSANYLWFCDEDFDRLGSRMKCNPSIKTAADRAALRQALKDGIIDTIGSDHAPHLLSEKDNPYLTCPSGIPSIQQTIPVLLTIAAEENIPLTRIASALSEKIAGMLGIDGRGSIQTGQKADLVIMDPDKEFIVGETVPDAYKCGWSPYDSTKLKGMVTDVYIGGQLAVHKGKLTYNADQRPFGERLVFRNRI